MNRSFLSLILITLSPLAAHAQADALVADIILPSGFSIELYTDQVPNARSLALGDQQTVFVSTQSDGRVYAVVPQENADPLVITLAEKLKMPNGIAFHEGDLYVAETTRILRFPGIEDRLDNVPDYEVIDVTLPSESYHGWRYIAFGPDGKLYVTIGAPCNVCEREGFAEIVRMNADGTEKETVAFGVRNSVGLAWNTRSGDLWFTDNGRDMMGDDVPPDELNRLRVDGTHFGFPYCHAGDIEDPEFGAKSECTEFVAPVQKLGPHVAAVGLVFYDGRMFPDEYRQQIFIAEHGSWNRSRKIGYRISMVRMSGSQALGYEVFAEGWLKNGDVSGRPVDLLVLQDGSMLVSDDKAGRLYRIYYPLPLVDDLSVE